MQITRYIPAGAGLPPDEHPSQSAEMLSSVELTAGTSATILPEFVTGIVLILIFGVWLRWLPISASWPDGAGPLTQI
ncbi:MAG TPA: hypothetical protein P5266_07630, partial [Candidatus Fermentibacter sp.]|nr:hypothetical protein [Candidatus Fermentibacter sp.]